MLDTKSPERQMRPGLLFAWMERDAIFREMI
jgi:hypothetical protein